MNQDDIIEMAEQAHQKLVTEVYVGHMKQLDPWTIELLKIFAKLVAQNEREACAYRARIALLGVDRDLAIRVDKIIGLRYEQR
jgi:hypothetical protein